MNRVIATMTVQQFEEQYGGLKPYFEYWFAEPVQKTMPTWVHSMLQKMIMRLLDDAGYESGAELRLKTSSEFQPLPDVSAVLLGRVELPYPTEPVDIVVEILSPDDNLAKVVAKCQCYADMRIPQIYVVDPESREVLRWQQDRLTPREFLATVPASAIWSELDRRIRSKSE